MSVYDRVYVSHHLLTEVDSASSICSESPMRSTSGRVATHCSFKCCSAFVRCTLSGDCRPWSRFARSAWTSGDSTDMVSVCVVVLGSGPVRRWELGSQVRDLDR
jgi:hypothetical protein